MCHFQSSLSALAPWNRFCPDPATMSHAAMPKEEREKRGITDGLLRLSVGVEHADDLEHDFEQALKEIAPVAVR